MINGNNNKIKISFLFNNYNNMNDIKKNFNKKNSFISKVKIIKWSNNKTENKHNSLSKNKKNFPRLIKKKIEISASKNSEQFPYIYNIDKSFITSLKSKSKVNREDFDLSSSLYRNYFIGYNQKGEFIDNEKIREFKRNLKSFSVNRNDIYSNFNSKNTIDNTNNLKKKNTLLTYNFNKDAYSSTQKLLISISNNSSNKNEKDERNKKLIYKLKRHKTAIINNYKSLAYPNIKIKSVDRKNKNFEKTKKIYRNKILFENSQNKYDKNILDNILRNTDKIYFNTNNSNNIEIDKKNEGKGIVKNDKKKELLEIIEDPNSLFHYVYHQIRELRENKILFLKNRKKGIRLKLENMKNELKTIEQEALYQVLNLRYGRTLGDEINIKTNIFCKK